MIVQMNSITSNRVYIIYYWFIYLHSHLLLNSLYFSKNLQLLLTC